jgi:hypothetical protein
MKLKRSSRYLSHVSCVHKFNVSETRDADYIELQTEYTGSEEI